jgi:alpha-L-fucosidase
LKRDWLHTCVGRPACLEAQDHTESTTKTTKQLVHNYLTSVGRASNLILNVAPVRPKIMIRVIVAFTSIKLLNELVAL